MKKSVSISLIAGVFIVALSSGACQATTKPFVARETPKSSQQTREKSNVKEPTEENISITHHVIKIDGMTLNYKVFAGYLPMKDEAGKLKANIFFTSYIRDGQKGEDFLLKQE